LSFRGKPGKILDTLDIDERATDSRKGRRGRKGRGARERERERERENGMDLTTGLTL